MHLILDCVSENGSSHLESEKESVTVQSYLKILSYAFMIIYELSLLLLSQVPGFSA